MSPTDAMTLPESEAPRQPPPRHRTRKITVGSVVTTLAPRSNQGLAPLVEKGDLAVVSAYYSLDTGRVEVLTRAPSA